MGVTIWRQFGDDVEAIWRRFDLSRKSDPARVLTNSFVLAALLLLRLLRLLRLLLLLLRLLRLLLLHVSSG